MDSTPKLNSFRLKNFKAIRDSGVVKFTPLTVLIGDNGSGKSSLVEGLQTYQRIVTRGLDSAIEEWGGYERIINSSTSPDSKHDKDTIGCDAYHIEFHVNYFANRHLTNRMYIGTDAIGHEALIVKEQIEFDGELQLTRDVDGIMYSPDGRPIDEGPRIIYPIPRRPDKLRQNQAIFDGLKELEGTYQDAAILIWTWQFQTLNPLIIGEPYPIQPLTDWLMLQADGSNIAEYLLDIDKRDSNSFEGIFEALQYVLPYANSLEATRTADRESKLFLQLSEQEFKVPGWLLSTGTLRTICLLALFRHPEPPPLIVIEEIENGLDPRTIHLIVDEIQDVVESGRSQVIVTTHSPYLLDLLPLSSIVMVEREDGEPTFTRPADDNSLKNWATKFAPGKLYTMGNLSGQTTI